VSHAQVVASRKRRAVAIQLMVSTAVRVEAGWDRTSQAWVLPNRLRITDSPLVEEAHTLTLAIGCGDGLMPDRSFQMRPGHG
jgi:hypothetical protein